MTRADDREHRDGHDEQRDGDRDGQDGRPDRPARAIPGEEAGQLVERAREHLTRLTGKRVETATAVVPGDDGWRVTMELVELERVPDSTSVLGTYEAEVDGAGNLISYERTRRYVRSQTDD